VIQGPASLPEPPALQRAWGDARIAVGFADGRSRLAQLYQDGCGKIRLPRGHGLEAVLINTAGGVTGGDRLSWRAEVGESARLTLTTQACEKVYRALDDIAEVRTDLVVGAGGRLDWLPQETILFDGGALSRRLEVDVAQGGRLLAVEAVILGRTAMDETVRWGCLRDRWRVRRAGRLLFADDLRLEGPMADVAAAAPVLAGARAFASLLLVADDAADYLQPVRAALGGHGGASAFDGKLFARVAASDGFTLRQSLTPALEALRDGEPLPRAWRN
jgi:urease accessory protein